MSAPPSSCAPLTVRISGNIGTNVMKGLHNKWANVSLTAALCTTLVLSTTAEARPHRQSTHHSVSARSLKAHKTAKPKAKPRARRARAPASIEGVLIVEQSTGKVVVSNNESQLFNPASNVKVATALSAIRTWGPDYRFATEIRTTGAVSAAGELDGDLYVSGRYMLFGDRQARALAKLLTEKGIKSIKGSLYVTPEFSMNLRTIGVAAGSKLLSTMKPQVAIAGGVKIGSAPESSALFATHRAPPLKDVLKIMLCYSDNNMAERFGAMLGGVSALRDFLIGDVGVDAAEVQLASTSGLYVNRLSPRAMMKILQAFQAELKKHQLVMTDLLPVAGIDEGTLKKRLNSAGKVGSVTGKTGTLPETDSGASSLSGEFGTAREGAFLFVIFHMRGDIHRFRTRQDTIVTGFQRVHSGARAFSYTPILPRIEGEDFWN